jgi:hypothetical protein
LHEKNLVMVIDLNYFVQVYENALEENVCDFLVSLFDQVPDKHERVENERKPNFTQFNLTENCKITEEVDTVHNHLIKKTFDYRNEYYDMIDKKYIECTGTIINRIDIEYEYTCCEYWFTVRWQDGVEQKYPGSFFEKKE